MALRGLRVVELAGLAPVPFAGMILAGRAGGAIQHLAISSPFLQIISLLGYSFYKSTPP